MSGFGIGERFYQSSQEAIPGPGQYGLPSNFQGKGKESNCKQRSLNWSPAKVRAMQQELTQSLEKIDEMQSLLEDTNQQHQKQKDELINLAAQQQVCIEQLENNIKQFQYSEQSKQNELQNAQLQIKNLEENVQKSKDIEKDLSEKLQESQICVQKLQSDVHKCEDVEIKLKRKLENAQVYITNLESDVKQHQDTQESVLNNREDVQLKVQKLEEERSLIQQNLQVECSGSYNSDQSISENVKIVFLSLKEENNKLQAELKAKALSNSLVTCSLEQQLEQCADYYKQWQQDTQSQVQELLLLLATLFTQFHEKQNQQQEMHSSCDALLDTFQNYIMQDKVEEKNQYVDQVNVRNSSNSSEEIQKFNYNSDKEEEEEEDNKENIVFEGNKGELSNFTKRQFIQYHLKLKHELEELRHQCTKLLRDKIVLERQISK